MSRVARPRNRALGDVAVAALALALLATAVEAWVRAMRVPAYLMPPPTAVFQRLAADARFFAGEAAVTLGEAAAGFALGVG
ncbi:MAG TPA: hypothetical protein VMJ92_05350, partial [Candidatus Limnocylindrales bacterium]|nr:hypothetical protein [Candidatus Limnocylindrales bacterium]